MLAGLLTDPLAPHSFGAWINYAGTQHVGSVSFLIVEFFLFFGVAVLTVVQASQVSLWIPVKDDNMFSSKLESVGCN